MNRNRRPMAKQNRKASQKEVKKGQKNLAQKEELPRTDTLTPKKALKKYPSKIKKIEKPLMDSVVNSMKNKKAKKESKHHSKRTTPGEVDHRDSPPAHIHTENERWKETLAKQNKFDRKILTQKLQRRKGKK